MRHTALLPVPRFPPVPLCRISALLETPPGATACLARVIFLRSPLGCMRHHQLLLMWSSHTNAKVNGSIQSSRPAWRSRQRACASLGPGGAGLGGGEEDEAVGAGPAEVHQPHRITQVPQLLL